MWSFHAREGVADAARARQMCAAEVRKMSLCKGRRSASINACLMSVKLVDKLVPRIGQQALTATIFNLRLFPTVSLSHVQCV